MRSDSRIIGLVSLGSILIFALVPTGCTPDDVLALYGVEKEYGTEGGGEDAITVHMPFENGVSSQCMQGAYGSYSHTGFSTKYDVDFDTPNDRDQLVFAPASGTAYVHDENVSTGFGLHINLDLGDGTYLLLAHLDQVFVSDGEEVGQGQILGFEGTTGASTGDHVHFGRHEGDAQLGGSRGESVEGLILDMTNVLSGEAEETLLTQDMACDLDSGDVYASLLPTPAWHPDGSLIMTPYGADVYVLQEGKTRLVEDEIAFWSRGYDFGNVVYVSERELSCYDEGKSIAGEGLVTAVQDGATTWLLSGDEKFEVKSTAWSDVLASWGITAATMSDLSSPSSIGVSLDDFADMGAAVFRDGTLLKESGKSDVYVVSDGVAQPIIDWDTYLALGFGKRAILEVDAGVITAVQSLVGSCATDVFCVSMDEVASCGGSDADYSAASHEDTGSADTGSIVIGDTGWAYEEGDGSDTSGDIGDPEDVLITWSAPSGKMQSRITFSGEYTAASGTSFGWKELEEATNATSISYTMNAPSRGDMLRFSVEFEDSSGNVSWSCLAPFPPGTLQGTAAATYNGSSVAVSAADDPSSEGCGLVLTVP